MGKWQIMYLRTRYRSELGWFFWFGPIDVTIRRNLGRDRPHPDPPLPTLQIQLLLANPSGLSASQRGPDQGYFVDTDILDRVPVLLIVCGVIYGCILTVGALLLLLLQGCYL